MQEPQVCHTLIYTLRTQLLALGRMRSKVCAPCVSAGLALLYLQVTSHPWPASLGLLATWGMVPKGEANQLRFHPTVGKAAVSLYPTGSGSAFSLLQNTFFRGVFKGTFSVSSQESMLRVGTALAVPGCSMSIRNLDTHR